MHWIAEGERIALRAMILDDAPRLAEYRNDAQVARYQSWSHCTPDAARKLIAASGRPERDDPGRWRQIAIVLRHDRRLIGDCAVHTPTEEPGQAEIGFTLCREYWGRGLASEAVSALVAWLFAERRKSRIFAVTDGRNLTASRLLEGLSFTRDPRFDRIVWFKGEFGPESVWTRSR